MGIPVTSDEDFNEQWLSIDQDQDGIVSFSEFKEFILSAKDNHESFAGSCQVDNEQVITAENLSMLARMFEENKVRHKASETSYVLEINRTIDKLNNTGRQGQAMLL